MRLTSMFFSQLSDASGVGSRLRDGDMVEAVVPKGRYKGIWRGRTAVRASHHPSRIRCEPCSELDALADVVK